MESRTAVTVDEGSVLSGHGLRAVFQPIVDLDDDRRIVGYEGLARGPVGSRLEHPAALFDAARRTGRAVELDWRCRARAIRSAAAQGLHAPGLLFVNAEPASFGSTPPDDVLADLELAEGSLDLVVEVTERDLVADPGAMIATLAAARAQGYRIALDDVGAEPASLSLMPVIDPDIIKLDLRLVQRRRDADVSEIACAVMAQAERSGAVILAEGIETPTHVEVARSLGARLGQGFLFARPAEQVTPASAPDDLRPTRPAQVDATPWDVLTPGIRTRVASKGHLLALSHHIEQLARSARTPAVLTGTFQHRRHFTIATSQRYLEVARHCSLVRVVAEDLGSTPAAGVSGRSVPADHPITQQWVVATLGAHEGAALIARDLGDTGADLDRRFEYVVTHDRENVIRSTTSLLAI
jgi:EAL domain-containing protein (putative c-di-GMP-specific phosphodiesterase class I)